jgi:hypothetical protein
VALAGFGILIPVVVKSTISWDMTSYSQLKVNRRFGGRALLVTYFHAAILFGVFFDPKDGGVSMETLVDFQRTTRYYIPDDSSLRELSLLRFYTFALGKTLKRKPGQLRNPVSKPSAIKDFSAPFRGPPSFLSNG